MKKIFILMLVLGPGAIVNRVSSQALYPVEMTEKITYSTRIIEGKVLEQRSFWNPARTMIFTASTIQVFKSFKGDAVQSTIEVMTTGGTVGTRHIEASDLLTLEKDDIGLFFCYPNSIGLLSPFTGNRLYDVYSSSQGCLTYDVSAGTASAPFARYPGIGQLYKELIQRTGRQPVIINPSFNIAALSKPQTPLAPVISSFSPQLVNAGATLDPANNLLIINGSGFNDSPSDSCAVLFDDANDGAGGTPFRVFYSSPLVQSWTDNQIRIRVPSRAGTGTFQVRDSLGVSITSPDILSIRFSVLSGQFSSGGSSVIKESNLMNSNGSGGYTLFYSNSVAGGGVNLDAAPEKETFQRALNTWKEVAGLNFIEGGTIATQSVGDDGTNVILFDNSNTGTTPLAAGVLAVCYFHSNMCTPITVNEAQRTGFDIVIRNEGVSSGTVNFSSGPCPPATAFFQIDLETVLLHELGHALNLGHVNDGAEGASLPNVNPGKLMNYSVSNGVSRRSPDYSALAGALYCINPQSNAYGSCTLSNIEMVPLTRTVVATDECPVNFPVVSTPPGTTINFDLVHTTSNVLADPAYNNINCAGTGTSVTNNAYYAMRSDEDGGTLNIVVSDYATFPASVQGACTNVGVRLALFQVNSCPAGQSFPAPLVCRTISRNASLAAITGLLPNTNYLIYLDGLSNTKATFTLTLNGTVLPLTLLEFKGTSTNNTVNLFWKTTQEVNTREFMVEKSFDGTTFTQFAVVTAKGNSNSENNYGITDDHPFSDITFYRLKMVDKDGLSRYSQIIKITTAKKAVVVSRIFPNPTNGKLNFQIMADSREKLTVEAFDLLGKKVANFSIPVEQGFNEKFVNVGVLATGTYFIQVMDGMGNIIEKSRFIKN